MASNAITAVGAQFEVSRNGTTWRDIIEAKGAPIPGVTKDWQDVTHLGSEGYRDFIPGLKEATEVSASLNYTSGEYEDQLADEVYSEANGALYYRVTLKVQPGQTTGDVHTYRAYPSISIDENNDPGTPYTMTLTLRTTGRPTFTPGTGT